MKQVQIQISWLHQKPADMDLHCFLKRVMNSEKVFFIMQYFATEKHQIGHKPVLMYVNNKDPDKLALPCSLISVIVFPIFPFFSRQHHCYSQCYSDPTALLSFPVLF